MLDKRNVILRLERIVGLVEFTAHGRPVPGDDAEIKRTLQTLVETARRDNRLLLTRKFAALRDLVLNSGLYDLPPREQAGNAREEILLEIKDIEEYVGQLDPIASAASEESEESGSVDESDVQAQKTKRARYLGTESDRERSAEPDRGIDL